MTARVANVRSTRGKIENDFQVASLARSFTTGRLAAAQPPVPGSFPALRTVDPICGGGPGQSRPQRELDVRGPRLLHLLGCPFQRPGGSRISLRPGF